MDQLAEAAGMNIKVFSDLIKALDARHQYFHDNGCRLSDHGLDTAFAEDYTEAEINSIFSKIRGESKLSESEILEIQIMYVVRIWGDGSFARLDTAVSYWCATK